MEPNLAPDQDAFNTAGKEVYQLHGFDWLLYFPLAALLHLYAFTWRIKISAELHQKLQNPAARVVVVWHNRSFVAPFVFRKLFPEIAPACLISASRMAAWEASFFTRMRIPVIRGSTTRRSIQSFIELKNTLQEGRPIALSPDGPNGPAYIFQKGALSLARKTQSPILLLSTNCHHAYRLKTWDRHLIPLPFARLDILAKEIPADQLGMFTKDEDALQFLREEYLELTQDPPNVLTS